MKKLLLLTLLCSFKLLIQAQTTWPINDVASPKNKCFALTNATIVKDSKITLAKATLVIKAGRILDVGVGVAIPADATVINCEGKYIYPSFIDLYSTYGMAAPAAAQGRNRGNGPQFTSSKPGAYAWNEALKPEANASASFSINAEVAKKMRDAGFGMVLTHVADGIMRGTGALVNLQTENNLQALVKDKASTHFSFNKGSSKQDYPESLMGSIALLRQTFYDANWYATKPYGEGTNLSLQAINDAKNLPAFFDANDKWQALRANKIAAEFGFKFLIKAGGNEYQRIADLKATNANFIVPVNFTLAPDVEDATEVRYMAVGDLKHWEMAPQNPAYFYKNNIPFALTSSGLPDVGSFLSAVRKAITYGLSEQKALDALTINPASFINMQQDAGSLEKGKLANLIICTENIFNAKNTILQNVVEGEFYEVQKETLFKEGLYKITINNMPYNWNYAKGNNQIYIGKDTLKATVNTTGNNIKISFPVVKGKDDLISLQGTFVNNIFTGVGTDAQNNNITWQATFVKAGVVKADTIAKKPPINFGEVMYPFNGYGNIKMPAAEHIIFKNATVYTSEAEAVLYNTDVELKGGKITAIGKNLPATTAKIIDATGKFLSAGIIDEHSHIATAAVNEGTQSVTSEVRIADVVYPDDVNIYRQLSGGVTTSHILHGSANTIGGQTQLLKLRWGANAEAMKFENWTGFIKFALGENVKQSNWGETQTTRFPQTRMGVEQILNDAFNRAKIYAALPATKRKDLELDALVEIVNKQRFITCHSYVQSEITSLMQIADKYNFKVNTFTHILEGYKVADKMKAHGANASTFSDWWAYKMEVQDAIPQNAGIMQKVGLNVAINSDDAEMARRLNQEAAKSIKYEGTSEAEAIKMVTINPATMLHVDSRVGSIKVGKDADVVLWSASPLSIYAKALYTVIDGAIYFDRATDLLKREAIKKEKTRLVNLLLKEKKSGGATTPAKPTIDEVWECEDVHAHNHSIIDKEN